VSRASTKKFLFSVWSMSDVAHILERIHQGDERSADELVRILYKELRHLASRQLGHEAPGQSFQTSDLVHEAYLRLLGSDQQWQGEGHFFVAAAEAMRRILVERARKKRSAKHGGGHTRVELSAAAARPVPSPEEVILVSDLLESLAREHPLGAQIVKLHYFAGLSIREAARLLGISSSVAHRRWTFARAWLREAIQDNSTESSKAKGRPKN
jgi:RNA polymerase sigma factor (TIGR02999 family)